MTSVQAERERGLECSPRAILCILQIVGVLLWKALTWRGSTLIQLQVIVPQRHFLTVKILWYICTYLTLGRTHTHMPLGARTSKKHTSHVWEVKDRSLGELSDLLKCWWALKAIQTISAHHQQPGEVYWSMLPLTWNRLIRGDFLPSSAPLADVLPL